ncbi:hypothetical protein ACFL6C_13695, partial [Myxococcota bacterium]
MKHCVLATGVLLAACAQDRFRQAVPEVEVDPRVGFGTGYVGDELDTRFGIHSLGTGRVRITAIQANSPDLELIWDDRKADTRGMPVGPGSTLEVLVKWRPTTPGAHQSEIVVLTDVKDAEQWVVHTLGWAKAIPSCDDGNPCTTDRFDRDTERCVRSNNSLACDDNNACTRDDACFDGDCRGVAVRCDDDDVCTWNLCDPAMGCTFPPDPTICEDNDPCTSNICDPEDGCSFPDAPTGTPCGYFDCAIGHLCFFGDCEVWDITDQTDGMPCSDGDHCTDGDECSDGECQSGVFLNNDPQIIATFETYGGEGSFVAADGYRYLFADPDALRLTVLGADGELEHTATLPLSSTVPPVLFAPGWFVVANQSHIRMIDARDATAPVVAWERTVDGGVQHLARAADGVVYSLAPWVPTSETATFVAIEVGPYFLPISNLTGEPGVVARLAGDLEIRDLDADGRFVAWVSGTVMHWIQLGDDGNPIDHVQYPNPGLASLRRVSVEGRRIAVLGTEIAVYDVLTTTPSVPYDCSATELVCTYVYPHPSEPTIPEPGEYMVGCGASCPGGTTCQEVWVDYCGPSPDPCDGCGSCDSLEGVCLPPPESRFQLAVSAYSVELEDIALRVPWIFGVGPFGTQQMGFEWWAPEDDGAGTSREDTGQFCVLLDSMPGNRLDLDMDHLLIAGPIALPLNHNIGAGELPTEPVDSATRVTGPLHGNVREIVDAGESVLVGGHAAFGRIDLVDHRVVSWDLTRTASSAERPRVLRGTSRDAMVDSDVGHQPIIWWPEEGCYGPFVSAIGPPGALDPIQPCGLYYGRLATAAGHLWAFTTSMPDSVDDAPPGIRVWPLLPGEVAPVYELLNPDPYAFPINWYGTRVRASDARDRVATITPTLEGDWSGSDNRGCSAEECTDRVAAPTYLHIRIFDAMSLDDPLIVATDIPFMDAPPTEHQVAVDGTHVLVGVSRWAMLYDLLADPSAPAAIELADASWSPVLVPWMRDGRAWLTWDTDESVAGDVARGPRLTQIQYD